MINIPQESILLAEETGIHIGDGHMNIYPTSCAYSYCGHAKDDLNLSDYVREIMKKLYGLNPSSEKIHTNTKYLIYSKKELIKIKQELGLPLGKKDNIQIPNWIMGNEEYKLACVRGLFATDGYLQFQKKYKKINYYPQLKITSKSEKLISQVELIINNLEINTSICKEKISLPRRPNHIWNIYWYGTKNLDKFIKNIGFLNIKHQKRHTKWIKNYVGDGI